MRIRTRHKMFKVLIVLGALNYLLFLYDILLNQSELFVWVMLGFVALILLTLLLYLGVKPDLEKDQVVAADTVDAEAEEAPLSGPAGVGPEEALLPPPMPDEVVEVVEIPKPRAEVPGSSVRGPHHYRCPFCSFVFSLEATHLGGRRDVTLRCPYCSNQVRIPARPRIVVGRVPHGMVSKSDQAAYRCAQCGEVLRVSAPASSIRRALAVQACPHCGSTRLDRAVVMD